MIDLEAIRKRNEAFERELAHDCDPDPVEVQRCADTRDLLAEVERLRFAAFEATDAEYDAAIAKAETITEAMSLAARRDYVRHWRGFFGDDSGAGQ